MASMWNFAANSSRRNRLTSPVVFGLITTWLRISELLVESLLFPSSGQWHLWTVAV